MHPNLRLPFYSHAVHPLYKRSIAHTQVCYINTIFHPTIYTESTRQLSEITQNSSAHPEPGISAEPPQPQTTPELLRGNYRGVIKVGTIGKQRNAGATCERKSETRWGTGYEVFIIEKSGLRGKEEEESRWTRSCARGLIAFSGRLANKEGTVGRLFVETGQLAKQLRSTFTGRQQNSGNGCRFLAKVAPPSPPPRPLPCIFLPDPVPPIYGRREGNNPVERLSVSSAALRRLRLRKAKVIRLDGGTYTQSVGYKALDLFPIEKQRNTQRAQQAAECSLTRDPNPAVVVPTQTLHPVEEGPFGRSTGCLTKLSPPPRPGNPPERPVSPLNSVIVRQLFARRTAVPEEVARVPDPCQIRDKLVAEGDICQERLRWRMAQLAKSARTIGGVSRSDVIDIPTTRLFIVGLSFVDTD
ncbi:hypothetical protein WN48_08476 [Eufriesea mexicana]|nr:hypothetical protein WN48_08476 [Eufriesea mexicana]